MGLNILVTGVEGYVGGLVYDQLELFSRYSFMNHHRSPDIYVKPIYFIDKSSIDEIKNEKFDYVFHCAVYGGRRLDSDSKLVYDKNLEMYNLIKDIIYGKIIHFTSAADLGRERDIDNLTPNEVTNCSPVDYFGKSKNEISNDIIINNRGINLRIFNIYGRTNLNIKNNVFIDDIINKCINDEDILIQEDRYFDIFRIDNLKYLIYLIINNELNEDYNLVHKKKYKISDYIKHIINLVESKSNLIIKKDGKNYTGKNNLHIENISEIDPLVDLEKYLKEVINRIYIK